MDATSRAALAGGLAGLAAFGAAASMSSACAGGEPEPEPAAPAVEQLLTEAIDWCACNGLLVRGAAGGFDHCPVSLLPTPLPRAAFESARSIGGLFAKLVDKVARDPEWLGLNLKGAAEGDEFTKCLYDIYQGLPKTGQQQVHLGIHRSDYMLHEETEAEKSLPLFQAQAAAAGGGPKLFMQVELNTIASSFGCMGHYATELHRFMLARHKDAVAKLPGMEKLSASNCPVNDNHKNLPKAMHTTHAEYCRLRGVAAAVPAIVFVVQQGETNAVDQRFLEFELWDGYKVPVLRRSLLELSSCSVLEKDAAGREVLMVDGREVSLCYFRAGYTPDDYPAGPGGPEWTARAKVERSFAVKCPSIAYHLVGAKKVQQELAAPGQVEKFLPASEATALRACFAGLFELTDQAIAAAVAAPELFVLKPQREGGGNNFYGDDIAPTIEAMTAVEKGAYILMQRIFPPKQSGVLLRRGLAITTSTLSELGIFSVFVGDGKRELCNEISGHMLRTKPDDADEGGVAAGFAVIDSPCLID